MHRAAVILCLALLLPAARADTNPYKHAAGPSPQSIQPKFPEPPRLITTRKKLAQTKQQPDFAQIKRRTTRRADRLLESPPVIPDGYAGWTFDYACDEHGRKLKPLSKTKHQCRVCDKVYTDAQTVSAYRGRLHGRLNNAAERLAWAYLYSGDDRYAAGVRRILVALADEYPDYPLRRDRWGRTGLLAPLGGRRYVQSLSEAVAVISLAKAYDATRRSDAWTDAQREHVEQHLFRLTVITLTMFNQGVNNHQTWYNAGLMALASVLEDADLVRRVLTGYGGYYDQLDRSIGEDGFWYEGTVGYHRYALSAMRHIVTTGRRMGLPLHEDDRLRRMILVPLDIAYPDGSFPVINDADPGNLAKFDSHFQWGWQLYNEPIFAQAYARGDAKKLRTLIGEDAQVRWPLRTGSRVLRDAGLVRLQIGEGQGATCAFLDFGPHGGFHGHFDKLNLMLYANGREWLLDPGRLGYSVPQYKSWAKHTAAHNTVTIDGRNQQPHVGELLWFREDDTSPKRWAACALQSKHAYEGVTLRRYVWLSDDIMLDVFTVKADKVRQIDWLAHTTADALTPIRNVTEMDDAPESLGAHDGYPHLTSVRRFTRKDPSAPTTWRFGDAPSLMAWTLDPPDTQYFTSRGIGYTLDQRPSTLLRRRRAKHARFVTAYDLSGRGDVIESVGLKGGAVLIDRAGGQWRVGLRKGGPVARWRDDRADVSGE